MIEKGTACSLHRALQERVTAGWAVHINCCSAALAIETEPGWAGPALQVTCGPAGSALFLFQKSIFRHKCLLVPKITQVILPEDLLLITEYIVLSRLKLQCLLTSF